MNSVTEDEKFEEYEENFNTVLSVFKKRVTALLGDRLRKIVLYGSRARGDYDHTSDIDIAIIVRDLDRDTKNNIMDIAADVELTYLTPLSTLVLSEDSFHTLLDRERRIALDIDREGIQL